MIDQMSALMIKVKKLYSTDLLQFGLSKDRLNQKNLDRQFDELLKATNSILFYLSNVEFQVCQQNGSECLLSSPIEVVLSLTNQFKWRDKLE